MDVSEHEVLSSRVTSPSISSAAETSVAAANSVQSPSVQSPSVQSPSVQSPSVQSPDGVLVSVLLFASLKDALGGDLISVLVTPAAPVESSDQSQHPAQSVFVSDLLRCCAEQHPPIERWLPYVKVAVNCEYASAGDAVLATDEIALLPPVSGGSPTKRIAGSSRF